MKNESTLRQNQMEVPVNMTDTKPLEKKPKGDRTGNNTDAESCDYPGHDETDEESPERRKRLLESHQSTSRLESLPAELRFEVLSWMPDLPTLQSLVHASPVLHAQYRENRNTILRMCLGRELDGFYIDAHVNLMTRVGILGSPRGNGKIREVLHQHDLCLSGLAKAPDVNDPVDGDMRWMAGFHNSVVRPLARRYSAWAFANLRAAVSSKTNAAETAGATEPQGIQIITLSRSEETRVFRALYRYEIFHHLFGRNKGSRVGGFRHNMVNEYFCCLFDPWEVEAIGCIDLFVRKKYTEIFNEIKHDLDPANEKFRQPNGVLNPQGSFRLEAEWSDWMEGTVSRGLQAAVRLFNISDHDLLVAKMARALTSEQQNDASLKKALSRVAQDDRRDFSDSFPNSRDEAENRREALAFSGDVAPPNTPPLGWVLLWNGTYSNAYGGYVPEPLRRTGYVIWDERRWAHIGAEDFVFRQWEAAAELVEEIMADRLWSPLESGTGPTEDNEDVDEVDVISEAVEDQPISAGSATDTPKEIEGMDSAASRINDLFLLYR